MLTVRSRPRFAFGTTFVALLLVALHAQSTAIVTRVIDGDTVVVSGLGTVRLIGVDTPETVDPRKPVQAFGREASAFLQGFLQGKAVRIEYDQTRKDRYDRTLAYLYLTDGTFVNLEIVRRGFGHAYTEFPFKYMDMFRATQREAMDARRGLWADSTPLHLEPLPRCQALTQADEQCKRSAQKNSQYCWQHQPK